MSSFEVIRTVPRGGDNYNYLLVRHGYAWWVDPLHPLALLKRMAKENIRLAGILLTHTHWDHIDGVEQVLEQHPVPVYVHPHGTADLPAVRNIQSVDEGSTLDLGGLSLRVHHTPGHHPAHVVYTGGGVAVVGDLIFRAGCGSPLFGGDMDQLYESITRLPKIIKADELLLWGHNYDALNLGFAASIMPHDAAIEGAIAELQAEPDSPMPPLRSYSEECRVNPFLRLGDKALLQGLRAQAPHLQDHPREIFFELRARRNVWNNQP